MSATPRDSHLRNAGRMSTLLRGALTLLLPLVIGGAGCGGTEQDMLGAQDPASESANRGTFNSFAYCNANPRPPKWWYKKLLVATRMMPHVPDWWGKKGNKQSLAITKIVCQESSYSIHATNGSYIGMYQMNKGYFPVGNASYNCYWNGCKDGHGHWHPAAVWQDVAGLRYIVGRYHTPAAAWSFKLAHGWY